MNRRVFPGGSYVEALPTGEYAVLSGRVVVTHQDVLPLPVWGAPLYLRITTVGGFQIAGQASDALGTLHWRDGDWQLDPRIAHGQSGCIFDAAGVLRIIEPGEGVTSQGYRYVDDAGTLVLGDATIFANGLSEYSTYGGISIGQGHDGGGVQVWDGATLRVLDTGDCRFIRVRGDGEHVAISYWRGPEAAIVQTSLSELRALPPFLPSPPSNPPPVPQPQPEPVPMPAPVNRLADVQRIRAKYPTPLGESHWRFLVEVCQAVGAQLYRKDGGDHVFVPPLNRYVSLDVIGRGALGDWWIDILGDAENEARPAWDAHEGAAGEYLDVSGIVLDGSQPPPQTPPPSNPPPAPSVDLSPVLAQLAALRAELAAVGQKVDAVSRQIQPPTPPVPPSVTFPDYRGAVPYLGTITLKPVK